MAQLYDQKTERRVHFLVRAKLYEADWLLTGLEKPESASYNQALIHTFCCQAALIYLL